MTSHDRLIQQRMERLIAKCQKPERGQTTMEDIRNDIRELAECLRAIAGGSTDRPS